jgi:hypothetical protein
MAEPGLIDAYLAALASDLPAARVAELADGLAETYDHHRARGLDEARAERAALAEFGDPGTVLAAFAAHSTPRRAARILLAGTPLLAAAWAVVLIAGHATAWSVPRAAWWVLAAITLLAIAALFAAARTARPRRMRPAALTGCAGVILVDAVVLAFLFAVMPAPCWALNLAAPLTAMHLAYAAAAVRTASVRAA